MFDSDIATEYGIKEAILLQFFYFWDAKNRANNSNFRDGRYWTFNSVKAFETLFPYMTKDQIRRTLDKMCELGLIVKDNLNQNPHDRTLWYALTDMAKAKVEKCQMDLAQMPNGNGKNAKSYNTTNNIYSSNTVNNIIAQSDKNPSEPKANVSALILNNGEEWLPEQSLFEEYIELYPNVDIEYQFKAMRVWCLSNPKKRKTKTGIKRFVNQWLDKEQNKNISGYKKVDNGNKYNPNPQLKEIEDKRKGVEHIDDWTKVDEYGNYHPEW